MAHRELVERWFNEGWGKKNEQVLDELFAPDFNIKGLHGETLGREDFRQFFRSLSGAFEHVQITINECSESGSDFAVQATLTLTDRDGSKHSCAGAVFGTVKDGKFTRTQDQWDFSKIFESAKIVPSGAFARMVAARTPNAALPVSPNRAFLDTWFHRLWGLRDRTVIDEMVDEQCAIVGLPDTKGRAAFHTFFEKLGAAFPKIDIVVEESVEQGETIAFRCRATATDHAGKEHDFPGGGIVKIRDGKMIDAWNQWDFLNLVESTGGIPKGSFGEMLVKQATHR